MLAMSMLSINAGEVFHPANIMCHT
jgi:hypothetical protein